MADRDFKTNSKFGYMLYKKNWLALFCSAICKYGKQYFSSPIVLFWIISLFAFRAESQVKPSATVPIIIYDTIKQDWQEVVPGEIPKYSSIITDAKGNIYAPINEPGKGKQISVLSNGKWKNIHQGLPDDTLNLIDPELSDDIHVISFKDGERTLYKLVNGKWEMAVKNKGFVFLGNDSKYYGLKEIDNSMSILVKWENGDWLPVGPPGNPIVVHKYARVVIDQKGVLYFGYEEKKDISYPVKMWDGKAVTEIGRMPNFIYQLELDKKGNLYANTHYSKNWYFKQWNGIVWTDMILPDDIERPDEFATEFDFNNGTIYLKGRNKKNPSKDDHLFYRYENDNKWTLLLTYKSDDVVVNPFETNNKVYAVKKYPWVLSTKTIKIFRQETYPFIFKQSVTLDNEIKKMLNSLRLVKLNGKYGITDNKGDTLLYPAFNEILIGQVSNEETGNKPVYTFRLSLGGESFDCTIRYSIGQKYLYPNDLYSPGKDRVAKKCENCGGSGSFAGIKEVYVKGEKIPEKTTTTTTYKTTYETRWDPKTNTNRVYSKTIPVTTTTTSGGGTKPGYYEKEKIEEKCKMCSGYGRVSDSPILEYDKTTRTYKKSKK